MRILVALGGNALLKRGEKLTAENQRRNVRAAVERLIPVIETGHEVIITHGSGPQIGLLSLQAYAYKPDEMFPLDVLDAEVSGLIGYVVEQELYNASNCKTRFATLLTQIVVDERDPAFLNPTKPIGPVLGEHEADRLARSHGWKLVPDGKGFRRAVPSPKPKKIVEADVIRMLVEQNVVVICGGGGGIPVIVNKDKDLVGVEAVIDKDHSSCLIAEAIDADMLLLLTDVDGVYQNWGAPNSKRIVVTAPDELDPQDFPAGSMRPKVEACSNFAKGPGRTAVIGSIDEVGAILQGSAGTLFVGH